MKGGGAKPQSDPDKIVEGKYYALIIGVENYINNPDIKNIAAIPTAKT